MCGVTGSLRSRKAALEAAILAKNCRAKLIYVYVIDVSFLRRGSGFITSGAVADSLNRLGEQFWILPKNSPTAEEQHEIKVFGTFTDDLKLLQQWLSDHECPVVAVESTGIYRRPVNNVLEEAVHAVPV